jgi:hypothetical protein
LAEYIAVYFLQLAPPTNGASLPIDKKKKRYFYKDIDQQPDSQEEPPKKNLNNVKKMDGTLMTQPHHKLADTNVARRATTQTSVPMGTTMTRHQLDQVKATAATTAGLTTLDWMEWLV